MRQYRLPNWYNPAKNILQKIESTDKRKATERFVKTCNSSHEKIKDRGKALLSLAGRLVSDSSGNPFYVKLYNPFSSFSRSRVADIYAPKISYDIAFELMDEGFAREIKKEIKYGRIYELYPTELCINEVRLRLETDTSKVIKDLRLTTRGQKYLNIDSPGIMVFRTDEPKELLEKMKGLEGKCKYCGYVVEMHSTYFGGLEPDNCFCIGCEQKYYMKIPNFDQWKNDQFGSNVSGVNDMKRSLK